MFVFRKNLVCFVFLLPPFWNWPYCIITDDLEDLLNLKIDFRLFLNQNFYYVSIEYFSTIPQFGKFELSGNFIVHGLNDLLKMKGNYANIIGKELVVKHLPESGQEQRSFNIILHLYVYNISEKYKLSYKNCNSFSLEIMRHKMRGKRLWLFSCNK